MRVLVVGAGIAGATCALDAAGAGHDVTLLRDGPSATSWAQGGLAVAWGDDTAAAHAADVVAAGDGLCDPAAVEVVCGEGPGAVARLVARGVAFDRDASGAWARGREAAHGAARVLHARGDATGAAIQDALDARTASLDVRPGRVVALRVVDGAVTGVRLADGTGLAADAVVLATGGAGALYPTTSNPPGATGSGLSAALRAGAVVSDLEMVQFHPTCLAVGGGTLVSEAVRGEGAVLRDARGRRFMTAVDPRAELAPRDVVARAIARAMADGPVVLDATGLGADRLRSRFPGLTRTIAAAGVDWTRGPVPVAPAAHYWMGGVRTDLSGRTSLPGLLAVGEVARTGLHGANRLASSSLLEGVVMGARAAAVLDEAWPEPEPVDAEVVAVGRGDDPLAPDDLAALLWEHVGLERDAAGLGLAARRLERAGGPEVDLARALVASALVREESRGAHVRLDHPGHAPGPARATHVVAKEVASC